MQKFSEYINESVFDIEKNIQEAPNWEKIFIDWLSENGGVTIRGTGCDCLGRKVEPGDWVVFLDAGGAWGTGKRLNIGKAIAVKKQISIALFIPKMNEYDEAIARISRPSEYVFKIEDPEKLAGSIL